jgi:hypothetical protein
MAPRYYLPRTLLALLPVACSSPATGSSVDASMPSHDTGAMHDGSGQGHDSGGKGDSGSTHGDSGKHAADAGDGGAAHDTGVDAPLPCSPSASCPALDKTCIGLSENMSKGTFALRMTEIIAQKPAVFASGPLANALFPSVPPNLPSCNLGGLGTFSWLLQFNLSAQTLTVGGAAPVADPTQGYNFVAQTLDSIMVQPTILSDALVDGGFMANAGTEVDIPLFFDTNGDNYIVLPIGGMSLTGTLSADSDCIGTYDPSALQKTNGCQPADGGHAFTPGGLVTGYVLLDEADSIEVSSVSESLCVLLTGDPTMYGTTMGGETVCKRDGGGKVVFQGDWCSNTNSAATMTCADSMQLSLQFSAGSVLIKGDAGM